MTDYGFANSELSKMDKGSSDRKEIAGSALTAAGGATAGLGLVGGGIPGFKSNSSTIANMREGSKAQRTGAAMSSGRGGIFGYRIDAHTKARTQMLSEKKKHSGDKKLKYGDAFNRGRGTGKIAPETEVIRHLKRGRLLSHGLLAGGAAAAAYGVHTVKNANGPKTISKSQSEMNRYNGAAVGLGTAGAVGSVAGDKILSGQAKRWKAKENANLGRAQKLVPRLKTTMHDEDAAKNGNTVFRGKAKAAAEEAGRLRGYATQQRHFSSEYSGAAKAFRKGKYPSLAVAGVGATELALSRKKKSNDANGA
jgi:hypothetical protein